VRAILLEEAYRGRTSFEVFPWNSERSQTARSTYDFGADQHGLVVLDAQGQVLTLRQGHDYGEAEIRADLDRALGRCPPKRRPLTATDGARYRAARATPPWRPGPHRTGRSGS